MKSATLSLICLLCSFVAVCNGKNRTEDGTETSDESSFQYELMKQILNKGPILSIELKLEFDYSYTCQAQSLSNLKYDIFPLFSTQGSYLKIYGRVVYPDMSGGRGRVAFGCEVSTEIQNKVYKAWTYKVEIFSEDDDVLYERFQFKKGKLGFQQNNTFYSLISSNETHVAAILNQACRYMGYPYGQFKTSECEDTRYLLQCGINSKTLKDCEVTENPFTSQNCTMSTLECSYGYVRTAAPEDLDTQLSIYPDRPIEENDNVTVTCSSNFYPKLSKMISLQRIDFKGQKTDLITSIKDISFTFYEMSFSFNYIAKRDLIKDTFICSVTDSVSLQSNQTERHLEYKMAFSQINISVYRSNDGGELIDISGQIDQYRSASLLKCEADSEHPMPQYLWFYTAKNGEKMRKTSKQLKLEDVEKRMNVECRVSQQMLSDNFTDSVSLQFVKSINDSQLHEEFNATVCQSRNKLQTTLECPSDEDLLISRLSVGYSDDCEIEDAEKCSFKLGAEFIRNERCKGINQCEISISFMKKPYLAFIMKQNLPSECFNGQSAVMRVNYICLKKQ